MASIYANSCFTIIAADGFDANYGLPGISSPRHHDEITFEFGSDLSMVKRPQVGSFERKPFWHSRAWNFQERAVSPRTLVFTNNTVYWDCFSARWFENIKASPDLPDSLQPSYQHQGDAWTGKKTLLQGAWPSYILIIQPWPDLEQYFNLIDGFNGRNLTFETDALLAFTAIISAMSKSFPGGFHYGLPVFHVRYSASVDKSHAFEMPHWVSNLVLAGMDRTSFDVFALHWWTRAQNQIPS